MLTLQLATYYPGVQGIGYSVRLPGRSINAAEAALAPYGAAGVSVFPATPREEIHAIVHLEPHDRRNLAALGYDMFTEPVRRAAMERARDTGLPAISGRVQLVQEIDEDKQAGFLIYVPIYQMGTTPAELSERRKRLQGYIYSPFRADDLMRGIFAPDARPRVQFAIYDGVPEQGHLLHQSADGASGSSRFQAQRALRVAGRDWTVIYRSAPDLEISSSREFVPAVLLSGLFGTLLLGLLTWRQEQAQQCANEAAFAASASARILEYLHGTAAQLSTEKDPDRLIQRITDAGRELSGAEIGAFFYNVTDGTGESYMLYALSGIPREQFEGMGMPRNTAIFGPTFRGEGPIRSDDITQDSRFGQNTPFRGFPPGHWPVRSYLAIPVVSPSGGVLGGLFFGHSMRGRFSESAERSIAALAIHASVALDNARLFEATQQEIIHRQKIEEQQNLLLDELNHRVKNTLAVVQSIASQTVNASSSLPSFRQAFEGRLIALSTAHNLLADSNWSGANMMDLIELELAPYSEEGSQRVRCNGPAIWLPSRAALSLSLVVHELATNAVRHGALSSRAGRVEVAWHSADMGEQLHVTLTWVEVSGPLVQKPERFGFGSRMIDQIVRHDLAGSDEFEFASEGLRCTITFQLSSAATAAA